MKYYSELKRKSILLIMLGLFLFNVNLPYFHYHKVCSSKCDASHLSEHTCAFTQDDEHNDNHKPCLICDVISHSSYSYFSKAVPNIFIFSNFIHNNFSLFTAITQRIFSVKNKAPPSIFLKY